MVKHVTDLFKQRSRSKGLLNERDAVIEIMTALKRAGADIIVTYWARELAKWLRE